MDFLLSPRMSSSHEADRSTDHGEEPPPLDLLRAADADPVRAPGTGDTATPDITIEPHRSASAIDVVGAPDHGAGFFGCARAQLL